MRSLKTVGFASRTMAPKPVDCAFCRRGGDGGEREYKFCLHQYFKKKGGKGKGSSSEGGKGKGGDEGGKGKDSTSVEPENDVAARLSREAEHRSEWAAWYQSRGRRF